MGVLHPRGAAPRQPVPAQRRQQELHPRRRLSAHLPRDAGGAGMSGIVVQKFERTPLADIAALAEFGVATIHEAQGRKGLLASYMRPIYAGRPGRRQRRHRLAAAGRQLDDPCRRRASAARATSSWWRRPSPSDDGYFGELLACSLASPQGARPRHRGRRAATCAALTEMKFPVWSTRRLGPGHRQGDASATVNLPLVMRRRSWSTPAMSSWPTTTASCIVAARRGADAVTAKSREREAKEAVSREKLSRRRARPRPLRHAREERLRYVAKRRQV